MHEIKRSLLLPFNAHDLFNIIKQITEYPEFLPYLSKVEIHHQKLDTVIASMHLKHGSFEHCITTENQEISPLTLTFKLIDGPLEALSGSWSITELSDNAAKVEFNAQFKLNKALSTLGIHKLIRHSTETFITAFENRSRNILRDDAALGSLDAKF